jgi:putative cardiolipin synthase
MLRIVLGIGLALGVACAPVLKKSDMPAEPPSKASNEAPWSNIAELRQDDWFYLLNTGQQGLEWRLRSIDSASSSIDLQTFLWSYDSVGRSIMLHLLAAADRGVKVRILLDDSFLSSHDLSIAFLAKHPNIRYRIYNPATQREGSLFTKQLANLNAFARLDHRMHNKSMIIDGRSAIVGGRNLADEYFGYHSHYNFRDMEVLVSGSIVNQLGNEFSRFWNSPWAEPYSAILHDSGSADSLDELRRELASSDLAAPPPAPAFSPNTEQWLEVANAAHSGKAELLFDLPPDDPAVVTEYSSQLATELIERLGTAEKEMIIVSAYFIPTPKLEQFIGTLKQRNVTVRVLTNSLETNNHTTAHSAYQKHRQGMLEQGAQLHEIRPNAKDRSIYMHPPVGERILGLHAKTLLVDDDHVFIGSTNLDPRSLRINTEMGLWIESPGLNQALREELGIDLQLQNAWRLILNEDKQIVWQSEDSTTTVQPSASFFRRLENWFFGLLPIENEM